MAEKNEALALAEEIEMFARERLDRAYDIEQRAFAFQFMWEIAALLLLGGIILSLFVPAANRWVAIVGSALLLGVSIYQYRRGVAGEGMHRAKHEYYAYRYALMLQGSLICCVLDARLVGDDQEERRIVNLHSEAFDWLKDQAGRPYIGAPPERLAMQLCGACNKLDGGADD